MTMDENSHIIGVYPLWCYTWLSTDGDEFRNRMAVARSARRPLLQWSDTKPKRFGKPK